MWKKLSEEKVEARGTEEEPGSLPNPTRKKGVSVVDLRTES